MIIFAGLVIGATLGALTARRRGGRMVDILQYAAGYGIAFGILGVFATIVVGRLLAA